MEISDSSISIFYVSKILSLAPYAVRRNSKGVYIVQKSKPTLFYAAAVASILVILTYRGIIYDANSKTPVRMTTPMMKVVVSLDVSVVVMAIIAGVICGILGLNATKILNTRLHKIDESLDCIINLKMERFKSFLMQFVPMFVITILLASDNWLKVAEVMKEAEQEVNVEWNIPFHCLYIVLIGLQVNLANTALRLARRFNALNSMLKNSFLPARNNDFQNQEQPKITTVKTTSQNTRTLQASLSKLAAENYPSKSKFMLLKLLAECHESLGKCVNIVSSAYGMAFLFLLVSCFLHILATSYFLFMKFLDKVDDSYDWLLVVSWLIVHSCRLLLVVEPCHRISMESGKTIHIMCEIERIVHDAIMAEEVKKFWQQLLVYDSSFSVLGLCNVNRQLLTSLTSAIATYLVILIQFQRNNG